MPKPTPLRDEKGKIYAYQVRWRDSAKVQRKRQFPLKRHADEFCRGLDDQKHSGPRVDYDKIVTVGELCQRYLELRSPHLAEGSRITMGGRIACHVIPTTLGRTPAFYLKWTAVQEWADDLRAKRSQSTTVNTLAIIRSALNMAVRDEVIPKSSAAHRIEIKGQGELDGEEDPGAFIVLEVDQVAAILERLPPLLRIIAAVQAHTGARVHEILGLLTTDLDLEAGVLHIRKQLGRRTRQRANTKTIGSRREIALGGHIVGLLRDHLEENPRPADSWLFAKSDGTTVHYGQYRRSLHAAGKDLGIGEVNTHAFRHHHASVLIAAGVPLLAIAKRLGHTSTKQVEKTYGHLMKPVGDRIREVVDGAWETLVAHQGSDGVWTTARGVVERSALGVPSGAGISE